MVFAMDMVGAKHLMNGQTYSDRFKAYRKRAHQILGTKASFAKFYPLLDLEVSRFLFRALQTPEDLIQHIKTSV